MLKKGLLPSALVLAGGLYAGYAMAGSPPGVEPGIDSSSQAAAPMGSTQSVTFEQADTNGDGYLSQTELNNSGAQVDQTKLDTDNDGRINRTEFAAFEGMQGDTGASHQSPSTYGSDTSGQYDQGSGASNGTSTRDQSSNDPYDQTDPSSGPGR